MTFTAERFWNWIDTRQVVRRCILAIAIFQTWEVTQWAMNFAMTTQRTGLDVAAMIGAVTGPITVFTGYVFRAYIDAKGEK